jgi:hypothetical protein
MTPTDFLIKRKIVLEGKTDLIFEFTDKSEESLIELLQDYYSEKTQDLQVERARLASKVLDKSLLIQKQSDKIKELEQECDHFIKSSSEAMKLVEELRTKVKKANYILAFFDIRMKGNDLYEQVKSEIKGGKEC